MSRNSQEVLDGAVFEEAVHLVDGDSQPVPQEDRRSQDLDEKRVEEDGSNFGLPDEVLLPDVASFGHFLVKRKEANKESARFAFETRRAKRREKDRLTLTSLVIPESQKAH